VDLEGATDPAQEAARSQTEGFATTPRGEVTEAEPPVEAELPGEEEPPVEAEPPGEEEPVDQADDDSKPPPRKERIPGYPPLYQRANETWRPIKLGIEAWPPKSLDPEEDEHQPLDPGPLVDFGSGEDGRL
jgi:hypothetical protein